MTWRQSRPEPGSRASPRRAGDLTRSRDGNASAIVPPSGGSMKTVIGLIGFTLALVAAPVEIAAQDLAIVNARILDGKGGVIERGSVVVRGGRIVSVGTGAAPSGVQRIDAQ